MKNEIKRVIGAVESAALLHRSIYNNGCPTEIGHSSVHYCRPSVHIRGRRFRYD